MFSTKKQLQKFDSSSTTALEFLDLSVRWNHFMSQEQTLSYLGKHEISSSTHVLEMCRILSEAKAQWSTQNVQDVTVQKKNGGLLPVYETKEENDWDRFLLKLNEIGQSEQQVKRLIKIWSSFSSVNGAVRKVYEQTAYLPTSKTALHLIASLNLISKVDNAICNAIINKIGEDGEIGVVEIREIKKNNGIQVEKSASSSSAPEAGVTRLKLPTDEDKLNNIKKKWKEIQNAVNTINNLGLDIKIEAMSPDEKMAQMASDKKNRQIKSTLKQCQAFVDKYALDRLNQLKDLISTGSNLTKEKKNRNKKINDFFEMVKTHNLTKQCEQLIKDKKDQIDREQKSRQKASSGNAEMSEAMIKKLSSSSNKVSSGANGSTANTATSSTEKSHWD